MLRDSDAAENRIISIPFHGPAATVGCVPAASADLQDPRCRADSFVDVEVLAVLRESVGSTGESFRAAKVLVLHTWVRPAVVEPTPAKVLFRSSSPEPPMCGQADDNCSSVGHPTSQLISSAPEAATLVAIASAEREHPQQHEHCVVDPGACASETSFVVSTPAREAAVVVSTLGRSLTHLEGSMCVAYFKPSSCSGSGRALKDRATLRIYNPVVLRGHLDEKDITYRLLCTQCWEPVASSV